MAPQKVVMMMTMMILSLSPPQVQPVFRPNLTKTTTMRCCVSADCSNDSHVHKTYASVHNMEPTNTNHLKREQQLIQNIVIVMHNNAVISITLYNFILPFFPVAETVTYKRTITLLNPQTIPSTNGKFCQNCYTRVRNVYNNCFCCDCIHQMALMFHCYFAVGA